MIEFDCPECGNPMEVPETITGGDHTCSNCGAAVEVPDNLKRGAGAEPVGAKIGGTRKALFHIYCLLYMVAPWIIIPLWAYHAANWWLLVGIAVSYAACVSSASILPFACYCIGFWMHDGIRIDQYVTFYFLCALWGALLSSLAEATRIESFVERTMLTRALSTLLPIARVLPNMITQAFNWIFGLPVGLVRLALAYARGIENLEPEKAGSIMRQLKKGPVGMAVLTLGYFGVNSYYGLLFAIGWAGIVLWWLLSGRRKQVRNLESEVK